MLLMGLNCTIRYSLGRKKINMRNLFVLESRKWPRIRIRRMRERVLYDVVIVVECGARH